MAFTRVFLPGYPFNREQTSLGNPGITIPAQGPCMTAKAAAMVRRSAQGTGLDTEWLGNQSVPLRERCLTKQICQ